MYLLFFLTVKICVLLLYLQFLSCTFSCLIWKTVGWIVQYTEICQASLHKSFPKVFFSRPIKPFKSRQSAKRTKPTYIKLLSYWQSFFFFFFTAWNWWTIDLLCCDGHVSSENMSLLLLFVTSGSSAMWCKPTSHVTENDKIIFFYYCETNGPHLKNKWLGMTKNYFWHTFPAVLKCSVQ